MFAATVTLASAVITAASQRRDQKRLALDTVVESLALLKASNGGPEYPASAVVAGALSSLIGLGHPIVALRTLAATWRDDAVDPATATWLLNEILTTQAKNYAVEAVDLLENNAGRLVGAEPALYHWPDLLSQTWSTRLDYDARTGVLRALIKLLTTRDRTWWQPYHCFALVPLDSAIDREPDRALRAACARVLLAVGADFQDSALRFEFGWRRVDDVLERARRVSERPYAEIEGLSQLFERLEQWSKLSPDVQPVVPEPSASPETPVQRSGDDTPVSRSEAG